MFHVFLDRAALAIEGVELPRQSLRLIDPVGQQTGNSNTHVIQTASSIQARTHHKAQVGRADVFMVPPCHFKQGQNAGPGFALTNAPEALLDEYSVVVIQGNDIRDCAQGNQIQKTAQIGLRIRQLPLFSEELAQRSEYVEHHADTRSVLAEKRTAGLIGIHDGICIRQLFPCQMVIGHQHANAKLLCRPNSINRRDAVIHGHQQIREHPLFRQTMNNPRRKPITIGKPTWNAKVHLL